MSAVESPFLGSLTTIPGILVGHAHDEAAQTGCTVVLLPEQTTASVDVRGGAPGTRETDLLDPSAMVQYVDAICLCGGSAFGLAAATGVMAWLEARGRGFDTRVAKVPIVPAAVIFDLAVGQAERRPDATMGVAACDAATQEPVREGRVGVGCGATVGKFLGMATASRGGVGSAAYTFPDGTIVAALVVVNAFGSVCRDGTTTVIAGVQRPEGGFYAIDELQTMAVQASFAAQNTTLGVVATNAKLDKASCRKLAQMAHDGLARTIRPIHTPFDGDTIFAVATGTHPTASLLHLGAAAADVVAHAVERAVQTTLGAN
jgi:L-aminopeptidase/D-esterase-like protein